MNSADQHWPQRVPTLFEPAYVDYADVQLGFTTESVPEELVSKLHLVAHTESNTVVVCVSDQGWRFLPGGTRESGESLDQLAARELLEEAGACLTGKVRLFGAHVADSRRPWPYRPHLPHPRSYWAYGVAPVTVATTPSNPADAEQVVQVRCLQPRPAADFLAGYDPMHADVLRLAVAMGLV